MVPDMGVLTLLGCREWMGRYAMVSMGRSCLVGGFKCW